MKTLQTTLQLAIICFFTLVSIGASAENVTTHSGDWVDKKYSIKGSWEVVNRDGKSFLVLDQAFKTKNGPDLKIYLSTLTIDKVKGSNVDSSSIKISPLKSSRGAQEYEIPSDIDLAKYASVLIHCEAYSVLWGGGSLLK